MSEKENKTYYTYEERRERAKEWAKKHPILSSDFMSGIVYRDEKTEELCLNSGGHALLNIGFLCLLFFTSKWAISNEFINSFIDLSPANPYRILFVGSILVFIVSLVKADIWGRLPASVALIAMFICLFLGIKATNIVKVEITIGEDNVTIEDNVTNGFYKQ